MHPVWGWGGASLRLMLGCASRGGEGKARGLAPVLMQLLLVGMRCMQCSRLSLPGTRNHTAPLCRTRRK